MTKHAGIVPFAISYRWLARLFLSPLNLKQLEQYRGPDGRQVLSACHSVSALAPVAGMIDDMVRPDRDIAVEQDRFSSAFNRAFNVAGPRSAPPYASVYFSERGLLYQGPAREMNRILFGLQMELPDGVNEPSDHIGIQLHVAAELHDRVTAGQPVPIPVTVFLERHILNWLPDFADRCARLPGPPMISLLAKAALALVRMDVEQHRNLRPDHEKAQTHASQRPGMTGATH